MLEKETLDLKAIVGLIGERPFKTKENFKAYLEAKDSLEKEQEEDEIKKKLILKMKKIVK